MQVRFESRELEPFAETVSANDLQEGVVYFFLNFSDEAMLLPTMEPVVFIGRNLEKNESGVVYFQDIESYRRGARYDSNLQNENAMFYSGAESETGHVFEYEHALNELMRCSLRRRGVQA